MCPCRLVQKCNGQVPKHLYIRHMAGGEEAWGSCAEAKVIIVGTGGEF